MPKQDDELAALFVAALEQDAPRSSRKSRPPAGDAARGHTVPGALDRAPKTKGGGLDPLPAALARAPTAMHVGDDDDGSEEPTPPPAAAPKRAVLSSIAPARIAVSRDDPLANRSRSVPPPPPDDDRKAGLSRASKPPTARNSVPVGEIGSEDRTRGTKRNSAPPDGSRPSKPATRPSFPAPDKEGSKAAKRPAPSADQTRDVEPSSAKKLPRGRPADQLVEEISRASEVPTRDATGSLPPFQLRGAKVQTSNEIPLGPDGEPLIDHRGRSKPLYKPRRARPEAYKPPRSKDLLLGAFPGLRLLAHRQVSGGIFFAFLGLVSLVPLGVVLASWDQTQRDIGDLSVDPRWLGMHAAIGVMSLLAFELLRVGSASPKARTSMPRFLAAFLLPSVALLAWTPAMGVEVHKALEVGWLLAIPFAIAGLTGTLITAVPLEGSKRRAFLFWEGIAIAVISAILIVVGFQSEELLSTVAGALRTSGFRLVPDALARFARNA